MEENSGIYDFLGRNVYEKPSSLFLENFDSLRKLIGKKTLDLGCSVGRYSEFFSKYGEVIGIDLDKKSIDIAKKKFYGNKNLNFEVCDIKKFNSKDKFSTILFMGNSIAHFSLDEMKKIIASSKKNLEKGGIFMIEFSSPMEMLKTRNFGWGNFKEEILEFNQNSGIIKRKITSNKKELILKSYFWLSFMIEEIFKESKMKKIMQFQNKNNEIQIYQNEQ